MSIPIDPDQLIDPNTNQPIDVCEYEDLHRRNSGPVETSFSTVGADIDRNIYSILGRKPSLSEYVKITADARNTLTDAVYENLISNEEITRRFYLSNAISAVSPFNCSCEVIQSTYTQQILHAGYIDYVDNGLNGIVDTLNQAFEDFILTPSGTGVTDEASIVLTLNSAIEAYVNDPLNPATQADLDQAIIDYNAFAASRLANIQSYNAAIDAYNAAVGGVNASITSFNEEFENIGVLAPLPLLPEGIAYYQEIPQEMPPRLALISIPEVIPGIGVIIEDVTIDVYRIAETVLNPLLDQQIITDPTFNGPTDVQDAIDNYDTGYVLDPANGEVVAVNELNAAIDQFNAGNGTLTGEVAQYNTLVATTLDPTIALFNSNVVTAFNSDNATLDFGGNSYPTSQSLADWINAVITGTNAVFTFYNSTPPYSTVSLPTRDAMETAPLPPYSVGYVDRLAPRELYDNLEDFPHPGIPAGQYSDLALLQQLPLPDISYIPLTTTLPDDPTPYTEMNDFFDTLNSSIVIYQADIGFPIPEVPVLDFTTEVGLITYINKALDTWNSSPQGTTDLTLLNLAINAYNNAIIPFNDAINQLNLEVEAFNTGVGVPPEENLQNLNALITEANAARVAYGLAPLPEYSEKPLRELMPAVAPLTNPPPTTIPLFSQRTFYYDIPQVTEETVGVNFIFDEGAKVSCDLAQEVALYNEQINSQSFNDYKNFLTGGFVDDYNVAVMSYLSAEGAAPYVFPIVSGITPPAIDKSLSPTAQQEVNLWMEQVIASVSDPVTEIGGAILAYNDYFTDVNTAVASYNSQLAAVNGDITTLNGYAESYNEQFGGSGIVGPLTTLEELVPQETVGLLPPETTTISVTNGVTPQVINVYSVGAFLNSEGGNLSSGGSITLNALNAAIATYNTTQLPEEITVIQTVNSALATFNSSGGVNYFTELDALAAAATLYENDVAILTNGSAASGGAEVNGVTVIGEKVVNNGIKTYNEGTIGIINEFISPYFDSINQEFSDNSYPFEMITNLGEEASIPAMVEIASVSNAPIPGQVNLLSDVRVERASAGFRVELSNRLETAPEVLPQYFTLLGAGSDLEQLSTDYYNDLVGAPAVPGEINGVIPEYNLPQVATEGVLAENAAIDTLNAVIADFNAGSATSNDLKNAIETYVATIVTVNNNIGDLNGDCTVDAGGSFVNCSTSDKTITTWKARLEDAVSRLEFWGIPRIPAFYEIATREAMPTPPLPILDEGDTFATANFTTGEPFNLENRTEQIFPSTEIVRTDQNGEPVIDPVTGKEEKQEIAVDLTVRDYITNLANEFFQRRVNRKITNFSDLSALLEIIEAFDQIRLDLSGNRVELASAFIELASKPANPVEAQASVSLATVAIGLSSANFQSLLGSTVSASSATVTDIRNLTGIDAAFALLTYELNLKISAVALTPTLRRLTGRIKTSVFNEAPLDFEAVFLDNYLSQLFNVIETGIVPEAIAKTVGASGIFGERGQELLQSRIESLSSVVTLNLLLGALPFIESLSSGLGAAVIEQLPGIQRLQNLLNRPVLEELLGRIRGDIEQYVQANGLSVTRGEIEGLLGAISSKFSQSQFHSPMGFIQANEELYEMARKSKSPQLWKFGLESLGYTVDRLPFIRVSQTAQRNALQLGAVNQTALRDSIARTVQNANGGLTEADIASANALAADTLDRLNSDALLNESIRDRAIASNEQAARIRSEIVNDNAIRSAETQRQLRANQLNASLRDAALQQEVIRNGVNADVLAREATNDFVERGVLQDTVNQDSLRRELIQEDAIQEDLINESVLATARELEAIQENAIRRDFSEDQIANLSAAIQRASGLPGADSDRIAENVLFSSEAIEGDFIKEQKLRKLAIIDHRISENVDLDNLRFHLDRYAVIMDDVINKHINRVQILEDHLDDLREFSRIMNERLKPDTYSYKWVRENILDPGWNILHSQSTSITQAEPLPSNYKRDLDFLV